MPCTNLFSLALRALLTASKALCSCHLLDIPASLLTFRMKWNWHAFYPQWDSFSRKKAENIVQHMPCDYYFSRYTSPSNGTSNQLIELWVPHNYSKCSNWHPSISRQFDERQSLEPTLTYWHQLLSQLRPYCHKIFMYSFRCPQIKESIRLISSNRVNHAIVPRHPIHLPGYVTVNHCWTSSLQCAEAP
jgi:hypothetical protein